MTDVIIVDDDGLPIAGVDPEAIAAAGVRLAFDLAANCDDPDALDRITGQSDGHAPSGTASIDGTEVQATPVEQLEVTAREDVQVTPRELVTAAVIHVRDVRHEAVDQ